MYRLPETQQLTFDTFFLPFGGTLRRDNRWVRLADMIPWGPTSNQRMQRP